MATDNNLTSDSRAILATDKNQTSHDTSEISTRDSNPTLNDTSTALARDESVTNGNVENTSQTGESEAANPSIQNVANLILTDRPRVADNQTLTTDVSMDVANTEHTSSNTEESRNSNMNDTTSSTTEVNNDKELDLCPVCNKECLENGISCEKCSRETHFKCARISERRARADVEFYYCIRCEAKHNMRTEWVLRGIGEAKRYWRKDIGLSSHTENKNKSDLYKILYKMGGFRGYHLGTKEESQWLFGYVTTILHRPEVNIIDHCREGRSSDD